MLSNTLTAASSNNECLFYFIFGFSFPLESENRGGYQEMVFHFLQEVGSFWTSSVQLLTWVHFNVICRLAACGV